MKSAYVIGHITVKDKEKWDQYRNSVPATLKPWNAEVILRARLHDVLAGQHNHTDTVVLRFPNLQAANSWYSSEGYQALIPLRQEAADLDLLSFEE